MAQPVVLKKTKNAFVIIGIFIGQPVLYWALAIVGLVLALLSDGAADGLALGLLCVPLLAIGWQLLRARGGHATPSARRH